MADRKIVTFQADLHLNGVGKASPQEDHLEFILDLDFASESSAGAKPSRLRAGTLCPLCKKEKLDYDGQLNLSCPKCGLISGGCFT